MTSTKSSLEVSQQVPARREEVYQACSRSEQMDWYCPEDMELVVASADVRVGGEFRASMRGPDGEVHTCFGKYLEIVPNRKILFTHQWEGKGEQKASVETRANFEFADKDGGTLVTFKQWGFVDPEEAKEHEKGWQSTLRNLKRRFATSKKSP
ncbi:MAG TPA: SRPBCC domain-containing protein [Planctomycetota bacterium]|nr:SRPBCC domain-containing protein [Planctomycetota bacterium]